MFEYLMPLLVMPTYENTLLDQTYAAVVERQIAYGKQRGVASKKRKIKLTHYPGAKSRCGGPRSRGLQRQRFP